MECAEPAMNWDEFAGYKQAIRNGAHILPYIGHDEPSTLFYSNQPGSGNDVTYQLVLPKDPPTAPKQDGSGGTDSFELHPTFWFGMVLCDPNGSPNQDGAALTGHPTVPCKPDSNSNIFESLNPGSSHYIGIGPGQAFQELQFYPPGWVPRPNGISCTARQWCAALTIDTFADNENTGQFNNTACLNTAGPEPVNFAFLYQERQVDGAGQPAGPPALHPEQRQEPPDEPGGQPHRFTCSTRPPGCGRRWSTTPRAPPASTLVRIGGCTNTDGDFDGVSYGFNWPGSISNQTADRLLHPTSEMFSSPLTGGNNFTSMGFESDASRVESSDTAFRVDNP